MSETPLGNVAAYLPRLAREQPDTLAVAVAVGRGPGGRQKFVTMSAAELDQRSDRIAHGLVKHGIGEGVRTVLMVKPSPEFFAITFALLKIGAVMVMVDPGMGIKNLGTCLAEAEPEAFIGIPKAHVARVIFGWAKRTLKTKIMVGPRFPGTGVTLSKLEAEAGTEPYTPLDPDPEQTAAILFTSGSTGVPKGVVTPFRVFASQVQLLKAAFGIEPGERDLSTFPLFALFGPALGMASIVPEMDASRPAEADPAKLVEAFERFECTNMFASPALVDKLGRHCEQHKIKLKGLRRAISAGAPASTVALQRLSAALDEGREIFTPYGATECLPVSVVGSKTILEETHHKTDAGGGVCVGMPVEGMTVEIIAIDDEPIAAWSDDLVLPQGEIGEIVVAGPVVTPSYFHRDATKLAKITDGERVRHRMGDVGYKDEQGRLWMCGRKTHRVQTAKGTLFTVPCEAVFNTHAAVRRSALVGLGEPGTHMPVLCVELEAEVTTDQETITAELLKRGAEFEHTEGITQVLFHPAFPVDVRHNSKIFREKLAVWAAERVQ